MRVRFPPRPPPFYPPLRYWLLNRFLLLFLCLAILLFLAENCLSKGVLCVAFLPALLPALCFSNRSSGDAQIRIIGALCYSGILPLLLQ